MSLALIGDILVGAVGALHVYIFNLEALTWYRGSAKGFGVERQNWPVTATFAANQGFYNLVLAAGCFYSLYKGSSAFNEKLFFVTAVFCCGIIGFISTGSAKILRAQCAPTALALAALFYWQHTQGGSGLDTTALATVGGASALTVVLSLFVKSRLAGDLAKYLAKK